MYLQLKVSNYFTKCMKTTGNVCRLHCVSTNTWLHISMDYENYEPTCGYSHYLSY